MHESSHDVYVMDLYFCCIHVNSTSSENCRWDRSGSENKIRTELEKKCKWDRTGTKKLPISQNWIPTQLGQRFQVEKFGRGLQPDIILAAGWLPRPTYHWELKLTGFPAMLKYQFFLPTAWQAGWGTWLARTRQVPRLTWNFQVESKWVGEPD